MELYLQQAYASYFSFFFSVCYSQTIHWFEPQSQKTYHRTCAPSDNPDQTAHSRILIRLLTGLIWIQDCSDCICAQTGLSIHEAHMSERAVSYVAVRSTRSKFISVYNGTSIARTLMSRLSWLIRTRFLSPYEILPIAQEKKILRDFFISSRNFMLCVLIRIALLRWF